MFADPISGSKRDRPELDKMLDQFRDGGVVTFAKLDRLARSVKELLDIVETISKRGVGFRSRPKKFIRRRRPNVLCSMS